MKKRVMKGAILLAGVSALAGCGTSATHAALRGPSSHTTDRTTSARVITNDTSKKSGINAEKTLRTALKENRIRAVTMLRENAGWAYSREHVWAISDAGADWHPVWNHPVPILAFVAVSRTEAWMVTATTGSRSFKVWHTADGGQTWTSARVHAHWPIAEAFISVDAKGNGRILVTGPVAPQTGPEALFAIEQGRVVTSPTYSSNASGLGNIVFLTSQDGVAVDQAVTGPQNVSAPLFRTINGGTTWHPVVLPAQRHGSRVSSAKGGPEYIVNAPLDYVSTSLGYAALNSPRAMLYRTTNAGASWSPINAPPVISGYGISTTWLSPEKGWVMAGSKGPSVLWRTTNGGQTWTRLSSASFVAIPHFTSTSDGWALIVPQHANAYGGPVTFVRTTNGGKTWNPVTIH